MAAVGFELRLLGSLQLVDVAGRSVEPVLAQAKRAALLCYLAASRDRELRSRDTLLALFWPEADTAAARNALSQALFFIRHALGDDILIASGSSGINVERRLLRCDATEFEKLIDTGHDQQAVALYRGPFLSGFHVSGMSDLSQWIEEERARLSGRYLGALERLATASQLAGKYVEAGERWRLALVVDPLNTRVNAALMRCLFRQGDRGGALRQASLHARLLKDQLDLEPDAEILAIADEIRNGNGHPATLTSVEAPSSPEKSTLPGEPRPLAKRVFTRRNSLIAYSSALVLLLGSLAARFRSHSGLSNGRVLVAAFDNRTTDPTVSDLGSLAADYIADGLLRSGVVHVVDPATAFYALHDAVSRRLDLSNRTDLLALARSVHAGIVVWGSIYQAADSLIYDVRVSAVDKGELLDNIRFARLAQEPRSAAIGELRERIAGLIASRLDVDLTSLGGNQLAPPRLEAYQHYARGMADFQGMYYSDALAELLLAAKLDSGFVLPMSMAIYAAGNGGASREVRDSLIKALMPRRQVMSPLDRLAVDVHYWRGKDIVREREAVEEAARLAPGSNFSFEEGLLQSALLHPRAAIESYELVDRDRGWARGWIHVDTQLANALHMVGDYRQELAVAEDGIARANRDRRPGNIPWMREIEVQALAGLRDTSRIRNVILEQMTGEDRFDLLWVAGQSLMYHGLTSFGEELLSRDERFLRATGDSVSGTWYWGTMAFIAYYRWDLNAVKRSALAQLKIDSTIKRPASREMLEYLAIVAAANGAQAEATQYLAQIAATYPDYHVHLLYTEAAIAGVRGQPDDAVSLLQQCASRGGIPGYRGPMAIVMDPAFRRVKDAPAIQALFRGES